NGNAEGAIIVFRDVSKERESTHLRSDFSYASHQLRTPITEALWNLETGIGEQDADKKNEDLRIAHQSILSVKKLSEHLVSVSEIDQGNIAVNVSSVALVDILTETQGKFEKEASIRGVTVSFAPISPIIAITTDRKLVTKILFEVIENAVIYSHRGSTVTITTTQKGKEFIFEVVDTGVGIPEQEQVLMFTKFFRASNHGKENVGDGLGLYIAKSYVKLLGGKIWFESVEGSGTTFFISLPIA
ncbi:MAG: HAMP domain-containing sensor histidine kinase, partial [Minisyncoccia bacterium]